MSEHTPGPWRVKSSHNAGYLVAAASPKKHGGTSAVFTVRPASRSTEAHLEAKANAQLAAAAPELLAALRAMLSVCGCGTALDCSVCNSARAAIAKAEGKS